MYIYIYIHTYIHTYMHTCMHIYIYIYVSCWAVARRMVRWDVRHAPVLPVEVPVRLHTVYHIPYTICCAYTIRGISCCIL